MIELDGSQGEGGGQVLRTSLALALLTGQAFHLCNVRARRKKPGLQPQHLMSVRAAGEVGRAQLRGVSLGSSDLTFEPGPIVPGKYEFAIGTAGATGLVLQTVCLPLALGATLPSEVIVRGGTHVRTSPCFHFLDATWRAYLEPMGIRVKLRMARPGFYPRGGGAVEMHVQPCARPVGVRLGPRLKIKKATGFSAVAGLPEHIAQRQARHAAHRLRAAGIDADIREEQWEGGPGTVIAVQLPTAPAPTLFFSIGERGKPAEKVADDAAAQAIDYLRADPAPVDLHSADQLVLPLALAEGPSEYGVARVTQHLLTNVDVIRRFVDRSIVVEGEEGSAGTVRIQ